ncbi:MAG: BACON domain-containing protein [Bryobacteraceae bacterium]
MRRIKEFTSIAGLMLAVSVSYLDTARAQNTISVSPTQLTFTAQAGGASPAVQVLSVTGTQAGISFLATPVYPSGGTVQWMSLLQSGTSTPGTISVTVNPAQLQPGNYSAIVFISAPNVVQVPVTFNVTSQSPLTVTPATLSFSHQIGSPLPASQNLNITSTSPLTYNVTVTTQNNVAWLLANPTQGSTPGAVSVGIDPGNLVAGSYQGTITLTPQGQGNTPFQATVTLTVTATPQLTINPSSLVFNHQLGGTAPPSQTVELVSNGPVIGFTAASNTNWLVVTPAAATTPAVLTVSVQIGLLPVAGVYNGTITITPLGSGAAQSIPVTVNVGTTPFLNVSPNSLTFRYQLNAALPADQNVTVSSTGAAQSFTAQVTTQNGGNWLLVRTQTPTTAQPLVVGVNPAGLAPGTYRGNVTLISTGGIGTPPSIAVTLTISNDPTLILNQTAINFAFQTGKGVPATVPIVVTSSGTPLAFQVAKSDNTNWLVLTQPSGTTPANFFVGVNTAGLDPGSYEATLTVTAPSTQNAPITIPVRLVVSNNVLLSVSPGSLEFRAPLGGSIQPLQQIGVASTDGSALNFTVAATTANGLAWLLTDTQGGATPRNVGVTVNPAGLGAGRYTGTVEIASSNVANSPQRVSVVMVIQPTDNLAATPATLSFTQIVGGTAPAEQTIQIAAASGGSLSYLVSAATITGGAWLSVTPNAGNTPGAIRVTANGATLSAGTYNGSIVVTSSGAANSPLSIPVSLVVTSQRTLALTPNALSFTHALGGTVPGPQTISVTSTPAPVSFTVRVTLESGENWLGVAPASGATPGTLNVTVNPTGLQPGTYRGSITVTSEGATNSPQTATVTLTVTGTIVTVTPAALAFNYAAGSAAPAAQQLNVSSNSGSLNYAVTTSVPSGGTWLQVTPTGGVTPGVLTVTANPAGLQPGVYTAVITVTAQAAANSPRQIQVTLNVSAPTSTPVIREVLNGASLQAADLSAGLIFTIKGTGLGPLRGEVFTVGTDGRVSTTLANVRVFFDDTPSAILYAQADQINAIVPYGVANRFGARLRVEYFAVRSTTVDVRIAPASPGIFTVTQTGSGQGAILNQNNSVNSASNPADRGTVIALYCTGEGQTNPSGVDGGVNSRAPFPAPIQEVRAFIGGVEAPVRYAGAAPTFVAGVMQVNVQVPQGVTPGSAVPITIRVGTASSLLVTTVAIR